MVRYQEILRVGAKRWRKDFGLPSGSNENAKDVLFRTKKGGGAPSRLLGVDAQNQPEPRAVSKICAFGLPLSDLNALFNDRTEIGSKLDSYLTVFDFKDTEYINGKIKSEWYAVNKSGLISILLDPELDNRPVQKTTRVFGKDGTIVNDYLSTVKTKWSRIGSSALVPSRVSMKLSSKLVDTEVDVAITWFDQSRWKIVAEETNWKEFANKPGTGWLDFFTENFR